MAGGSVDDLSIIAGTVYGGGLEAAGIPSLLNVGAISGYSIHSVVKGSLLYRSANLSKRVLSDYARYSTW